MPAAIHRTMNVAEWGLLVTLSMLWGGSFFFNAVILAALPPFTLVAARLLLGAGFLYLVVRIAGGRMPVTPKVWAAFLLMGVLYNVFPFSVIAWG
ncbi:MAG: EamA family transporter, partial [Bauldia litoralis]